MVARVVEQDLLVLGRAGRRAAGVVVEDQVGDGEADDRGQEELSETRPEEP